VDEQRIRDMRPIDVDSHVIEAPDLYTSRVSTKKWGDLVPRVDFDDETGMDWWVAGGRPIIPAASISMAGWSEYAPNWRPRVTDIPAEHSDPKLRLQRMDEYGVYAQVLYPNVGIFGTADYLGDHVEPEFANECVRAYNDYLIEEWVAVAPDRYIATAMLPFWDLEETAREIERAKAAGHRGLVMSIRPDNFGLPLLDDRHWDPLWAAAQDAELSINFHIGSAGKRGKDVLFGAPENGVHANYAWRAVLLDLDNIRTISNLIFSGTCHRFPRLPFVSVESGIGWVAALLESMDWQWQNSGVKLDHPEYDMLPSEYFRRQVYACFWFEREAARIALEQVGDDNFLFETDFPHPTSMSPGPASIAQKPIDYVVENFADLPDETLRKVLHNNAAQVYGLALV
jgi:predicted TIM-barrel fold metal-dependent hydrolase